MRTTPNLGLKVWDSPSDEFNPADLEDNWDAIDLSATAARPASRVQKLSADLSLASLPTLTNTTADIGRLIYLDIAQTGYDTHTIVRWNGTAWRQIGQPAIMGSLPTTANYQGRLVALTAAAGGFAANDLVINTDGANTWKKLGGVAAGSALPGSPSAGDLFLLTAAASGFDAYSLVAYNGSAWARTEKRGIEIGPALPGAPYAGQVFTLTAAASGFNSYDVVRYNGASWDRLGVPTGMIIAFGANAAPTGWLVCDGTAVSRTTYSGLFSIVGTTWGAGDGSTTFNVPDLRGRMAVGKGTHIDVDTLADNDGIAVGSRRGGVSSGPSSTNQSTYDNPSGLTTHAHPDHVHTTPYLVINYLIKT